MTRTSTGDRIASLLREAGRAHHRAFAAANGDDPAWPRWYADYLAAPLGAILGRRFAAGPLAAELAGLDVEHREAAGAPDWPTYYAERLIARHGVGRNAPGGGTASTVLGF